MNPGRIFISGFLISFFGALPLGTINVTGLQILMNSGESAGLYFVAGCVMSELVYVWISLFALDRVLKHELILRLLNWISLLFMVVLAISSIMASVDHGMDEPRALFSASMPPFILGFILMSVNAVLLPFWFGWNTLLFIRKILVPEIPCYKLYLIGIALGTTAGYCVFIFFGRFVFAYLHSNTYTMNALIGFVLGISAVIHYLKIRSRSPVVSVESLEDGILEKGDKD